MKKSHWCLGVLLLAVFILTLSSSANAQSAAQIDKLDEAMKIKMDRLNVLLLSHYDALVSLKSVLLDLQTEFHGREVDLGITKEVVGRKLMMLEENLLYRNDDAYNVMRQYYLGYKAEITTYLIAIADEDPVCREMAIKNLTMICEILRYTPIEKEYRDLIKYLENRKLPSRQIALMYIHSHLDLVRTIEKKLGFDGRWFYTLGYFINDFRVFSTIFVKGYEEGKKYWWVEDDQKIIPLLMVNGKPIPQIPSQSQLEIDRQCIQLLYGMKPSYWMPPRSVVEAMWAIVLLNYQDIKSINEGMKNAYFIHQKYLVDPWWL